MKVMVNGATGLVGFAIVNAMLEAGHDVRASDHPKGNYAELEKLDVEIMPADLFDQDTLGKTVEGMDAVVHVAGLFDFAATKEMLEKINHQGTRNICDAVLDKAPDLQKFVQVASVGVYGTPVKCPCKEHYAKRPRNDYEKSKWRGELAAFEYHDKHGLPVTALRPTLVYGPRARYGHAMFIAGLTLYKHNVKDEILGLKSGPDSSHVHVDDVGRAAVVLAESDRSIGNSYNIADPNPVDGPTFIRALAEPLGITVKEIIPAFESVMALTGAMAVLVPEAPLNFVNKRLEAAWKELCDERGCTSDLRLRLDRDWLGYMTGANYYDVTAIKEIGMEWKWPHLTEGLKATIEWYREQEWIP